MAASTASPEPLDDGVDVCGVGDEGRRQQHVVAAHAVEGAAHRIDHQAAGHGLLLDAGVQLVLRIERLLAAPVCHQLDGLEQAASPHVADVMVVAEALAQAPRQVLALAAHVGQQIVAPDHLLHGERPGAGQRVAEIGVAVLEEAGALGERLEDLGAHEHGADRREAAAQALGDRHQVRRDALLLAGVQGARAAHAAHHLVEDQQDAVPVADLADALEVAVDRRDGARRGAADRLGDEGDHCLGPQLLDLGLELPGEALAVLARRLVRAPPAILEAGRDVVRLDQQRRELLAPPFVAADGERAQRIAVIALLAADEVAPLGLADLDEVLPRHLERCLDRLRAAADEIDVADAGRRVGDEVAAQLLRDLGGEEARVRVGELVELGVHGGQHVGMAVAEARHRRTARGVDVLLAGRVPDVDALAAHGHGVGVGDGAMHDAGHVGFPSLRVVVAWVDPGSEAGDDPTLAAISTRVGSALRLTQPTSKTPARSGWAGTARPSARR